MNAATLPETVPDWQVKYCARDLEALFAAAFGASHRTRLQGGAEEPLYQPAKDEGWHMIYYTRDYFRSALHEVAHWCVAGPARRRQPDYGYWYTPDGRTAEQQRAFVQVEALPQALELLFCAACGHPFRVSMDNLDGDRSGEAAFAEVVHARALALRPTSKSRTGRWLRALADFYGGRALPDQEAIQAVCR